MQSSFANSRINWYDVGCEKISHLASSLSRFCEVSIAIPKLYFSDSETLFMQNSLTRKPIEIKISTVVAVAVSLNESTLSALEQALKDMTGGAPDFLTMNSPS